MGRGSGPPAERRRVVGTHDRASGESGQGLVEFLLILLLIAIVALSALMFLGGGIETILSTLNASPSPSVR